MPEFILELVTDDSFVPYIGDKGVKALEDFEHIRNGPLASYVREVFVPSTGDKEVALFA